MGSRRDQTLILRGGRCLSRDRVVSRTLLVQDGRMVESLDRAPDVDLDLRDHLILPGLVNAHDHLWLNSVQARSPIAVQANSYDWIEAFQSSFDDPAVRASLEVDKGSRAWQGGLKHLLAGVTTCAHHDAWHPVMSDAAFPVRVLDRYGWSHSLRLAGEYGPPVGASFAATSGAVPWFVHLGEGTDAVAARELDELDALGALGPNTVAVHAVGLGPAAQDRLIARGAGVVWCPASNLLMLGETLEPRRLVAAGRLALATDSRLTGSRDLLDELRVAAEVSGLPAGALFRLVTDRPAALMRLRDVGHLDAGARADLIVLRDEGGDPHEALLRTSRSDIRTVTRDGRILVADADCREWLEAAGTPWVRAVLDGRHTLCAPGAFARTSAIDLEPGLALCCEAPT